MGKFIDLTGQKFGRLTVIKRGEDHIRRNGSTKPQWLCLCDCQLAFPKEKQKMKLIKGECLKNGSIKSCGCLQKEAVSKIAKTFRRKYNKYDLSGEYGVGYTSKCEEFYFDLEDYDLIKDYCWWKSKHGYILTKNNNLSVRMHRMVLNLENEKIPDVDHINHIKHDNRKINLRIATRSQNIMNQKIRCDNSSGYVGVHKHCEKWEASITIDSENIYLGVFDNIEDAINARKEAEDKYFGEYSYSNSLKLSTGEIA